MSTVKSFATGLGDTYYIRHGSDNFTIIDCRIAVDRDDIIEETTSSPPTRASPASSRPIPMTTTSRAWPGSTTRSGFATSTSSTNDATKPDYTLDFERYCEAATNSTGPTRYTRDRPTLDERAGESEDNHASASPGSRSANPDFKTFSPLPPTEAIRTTSR